jgi:MoxR-like ATPase
MTNAADGVPTSLELPEQLRELIAALTAGLIEREVPVKLALLAALSGEHVLLIGPPGTAKSEIARRLRHAFRNTSFFERLLTRFSVPEELFGPLSIRGLEEDRYVRHTEGFLPTASVAFIDEIFKANSAILNALLTLLNERKFDQGPTRVDTPLISVVGASNELPESDELGALYDRFLLRYQVLPVSDEAFNDLLRLNHSADPPHPRLRLSVDKLREIQRDSASVDIPDHVLGLLSDLRTFLHEKDVYVSDRRWRKIVKLLQTAALTSDRYEVDQWDCLLVEHCTWDEPKQREDISGWLAERIGVADVESPERLERLLDAFGAKLEQDRTLRTTHAVDDNGALLYIGPDGETTTRKTTPVTIDGEARYLGPFDRDTRARDDNKENGYTVRELKKKFRIDNYSRILHDGSWIEMQTYCNDPSNHLHRPNQPLFDDATFTRGHVEERCQTLVDTLTKLKQAHDTLEARLAAIESSSTAHIWVEPERFDAYAVSIREHLERIDELSIRAQDIHDGFAALPIEDVLEAEP